jgi:hypothetical protein
MPLFVDNKTNTITHRKYEFNAEYLDGLLDLIENEVQCYIVTHHPNRRFGYDVGIIKTVNASAGWEEVEKLGHYDPNNPAKIFYALVPVDRYKDYLSNEKYYTIKEFKQERPKRTDKPAALKEQFDLPGLNRDKSKFKPKSKPPAQVVQTDISSAASSGPRLVRDTEQALYTYKTPSQRYG